MNQSPEMSPADRRFVLGFLAAAVAHTERLPRRPARRQADYLFGRLMGFDPVVLSKVVALCDRAEYWGRTWQESSDRTRYALSSYFARVNRPGALPGDVSLTLFESPAGDTRGPEPRRRGRPGASRQAAPPPLREPARDWACLDAWLGAGRSLADFLDLWEPPR